MLISQLYLVVKRRTSSFCNKSIFSSVQFSRSVMSDSWRPHESQHARPPCPSPTPGVHSNSCPSSQWCHPTISSSVIPLSSCLQSFPASGSFPISQFFASSGQSIGASASASVLPMKIQDWFPLWLTVLYVLCWLYCMFSYHQVFFINNQATSQVCAFGYLFIALICIPTL